MEIKEKDEISKKKHKKFNGQKSKKSLDKEYKEFIKIKAK